MTFSTFSSPFLLFLVFAALLVPASSAFGQCRPSPAERSQGSSSQDPKQGIDDFNRAFVGACRSMNHDVAVQLWADDGIDLLPGMEPMVGKPEISRWLAGLTEKMKGAKVLQCDVDWRETHVAGDVAYEWGINTQTVSVPDRPEPVKNKGKIALILRKQTDGSWKLALESWNSSPQ
jgi:ketosteroid isomerase-like protein